MSLLSRASIVLAAILPIAVGASIPPGCLPSYTFGAGASLEAGADSTVALPDAGGGPDAGGSPETGADVVLPPPGDSSTDAPGSATIDAPADSPGDSPAVPDASITPLTVVSAGSKVFSTGFGEQLHFFHAKSDARYWLFYADDTAGVIRTSASADLVTWVTGSVSLGAFSVTDGNDFSVAYADLAGNDVVHIVANVTSSSSPRLATLHVRATISGGQLQVTNTTTLQDTTDNGTAGSGGGTCPQDGPSVVVAADGHVYDVTAWTGHPSTTCDTNIYRSVGVDTGTAWTAAFDHDGYYVSVPDYAYSHELLTLPEAGVVLAAWPDEDNQSATMFDSIGWALSPSFPFDAGAVGTTGTFPDASAELFYGFGGTASYDDWALCRLSDADVHAIRHVTTGGSPTASPFQELRYDGSTWQTVTSHPPVVQSLSNTGVVLLGDGTPSHGMLLATIGIDNAIDIARWTAASGWTTLPSLPGAVQRQSLAGSGCGGAAPHLFWTEGAGPYLIKGADLSSYLGP